MDVAKLVPLLFEIGTLRKIARTHRQILLTDDLSDNIAAHSFRVAVIAYYLARAENVSVSKVVLMALLHDIPEARSGDQNWIHKRYTDVSEHKIVHDQLSGLEQDDSLLAIMDEYYARTTKESKIAKDADVLDQILLIKEYAHQGNREASVWSESNMYDTLLFSGTAKSLASYIKQGQVNSWWQQLLG